MPLGGKAVGMRRLRWSWLVVLALAACAPPGPPPAPPAGVAPRPFDPAGVPAEGLDEARAYALLATDDLAAVSTAVESELASNPKANLVDGNQASAWTCAGYKKPTTWAQVQVGADATITGVGIKTGPTAAGCSYDVQVSLDGQAWTTALAGQRNTGWYLESKAFPAGVAGKFVRVLWKNSQVAPQPNFSVYELIVHGRYASGGATPTPAPTTAPTTAPTASPTGGTFPQYYPDLHPTVSKSFYVVMTGATRILRFPTAIGNLGPGHLRVRGTPSADMTYTDAYQEVLDPALNVVQRKLVGKFFWHAEHRHIHLTDAARYELRGEGPAGPVLRRATKVSFCLEDSFQIFTANQPALHPDCKTPVMGISRSWCDYYNAGLPGQEFDVTGLAAGYYWVVLKVDPLGQFLQARRDNDEVWTRIWLNAETGRTYAVGYSE